jgi:hypothetical protein
MEYKLLENKKNIVLGTNPKDIPFNKWCIILDTLYSYDSELRVDKNDDQFAEDYFDSQKDYAKMVKESDKYDVDDDFVITCYDHKNQKFKYLSGDESFVMDYILERSEQILSRYETLVKTEEIFDEADLVRFVFPTLKEALTTEPEADFFFNGKLRSGKEWLDCLSEEDLSKKIRISLIFNISTETDIYDCNLLKEEN